MKKQTKERILGTLAVVLIVLIFAVVIAFFSTGLLRLIGFRYESLQELIFFFLFYFMLGFPADFLVEALPKVCQKVYQWDKFLTDLLFAVLDIGLNTLILLALAGLMSGITLPWITAVIFSIIMHLINRFLSKRVERDDA